MKDISHQRYRISQISSNIKKWVLPLRFARWKFHEISVIFFYSDKNNVHIISGNCVRYVSNNVTTSDEKDQVADLEKNIIKRKAQLYDIDQTLPQPNGTYLKVSK